MKTVLAHILRKKRSYAGLPLLDRLRDERLSAPARLGFTAWTHEAAAWIDRSARPSDSAWPGFPAGDAARAEVTV